MEQDCTFSAARRVRAREPYTSDAYGESRGNFATQKVRWKSAQWTVEVEVFKIRIGVMSTYRKGDRAAGRGRYQVIKTQCITKEII